MKESFMKSKLLAAAVVALLPLAVPAADKTRPTTKPEAAQAGSFDTLDANKDGRISMPEASADPKLVESFSTADKNGDGYLDSAEYESASRQTPKQ
jgi:Ca2+-binding EF-hand superfamily protein